MSRVARVVPALLVIATLLGRAVGLAEPAGPLTVRSKCEWVRPGLNTNQPVWGIRGGLLWAIAPAGFRGGNPRGLIRLGYPVLHEAGYDLVNFIAIEPVVRGRRGFSELEHSQLDGVPGKRIWAGPAASSPQATFVPGQLSRGDDGAEVLSVELRVEPFDNGAQVRLTARQRSDRPDELELAVFRQPDSAPLDDCILTATMGNMARVRRLWLDHEQINSLQTYAGYTNDGFAPHREFRLAELHRDSAGNALVAVTSDETRPDLIYPFPDSSFWHYAGVPVTQFWRVPAADVRPELRAVVNARYVYWRSHQPIPGGVAFENFELRQPFRQGQRFVFGITRNTPKELGL